MCVIDYESNQCVIRHTPSVSHKKSIKFIYFDTTLVENHKTLLTLDKKECHFIHTSSIYKTVAKSHTHFENSRILKIVYKIELTVKILV